MYYFGRKRVMEEQYSQAVKTFQQELGDRIFFAATDSHCVLESTIYPFLFPLCL